MFRASHVPHKPKGSTTPVTADSVTSSDVERIVAEVMKNFLAKTSPDQKLMQELHFLASYVESTKAEISFIKPQLQELSDFIHKAKTDIASIRPGDIGRTHIPMATVELDAIIGDTAEATNKIMDECDKIMGLAGEMGDTDVGAKLIDCATRVYEACNFQDLTSQRIKKVVQALQHIEEKIGSMRSALKVSEADAPTDAPMARKDVDGSPLEGPQQKGQGISQDDIDRLLNS